MIPIRLITLVLKVAVLPIWIFKSVTDYAVTTLHIDPTLAFVVSAGAAFGSLVVSLKIPI